MNYIPNRIKQPAQCCSYCGKSYHKKTNLNNHIILCELLRQKTPKDDLDLPDEPPTMQQMHKIILGLASKISRLEQKLTNMGQYAAQQKRKIDIIEWLQTHSNPDITFDKLSERAKPEVSDIEILMEDSVLKVLDNILYRTFVASTLGHPPIVAFSQKKGVIYIYQRVGHETALGEWTELTHHRFSIVLYKIYLKLSQELSNWKRENYVDTDSFHIKCDKTALKIYSVDVGHEPTVSKIYNSLYKHLVQNNRFGADVDFSLALK